MRTGITQWRFWHVRITVQFNKLFCVGLYFGGNGITLMLPFTAVHLEQSKPFVNECGHLCYNDEVQCRKCNTEVHPF